LEDGPTPTSGTKIEPEKMRRYLFLMAVGLMVR